MRAGTLSQESVAPLLPDLSPRNAMALEVWQAVGDAEGPIDWMGLDMMMALHEIADVEDLVERLMLIRAGIRSA